MKYHQEIMSDEFTKHLLDFDNFHTVLHHFTGIDKGGPHDHPFKFTTHILNGGYVEKVYQLDGSFEIHTRNPGSVHKVEATCIHEIIHLPRGDCWTLIIPEEKTQEPGWWQFREDGAYQRRWNEPRFTKI